MSRPFFAAGCNVNDNNGLDGIREFGNPSPEAIELVGKMLVSAVKRIQAHLESPGSPCPGKGERPVAGRLGVRCQICMKAAQIALRSGDGP